MGAMCPPPGGRKQWIEYECTGKGKEGFLTYENEKLRVSLEKAMKKMNITMKEINNVTYCYNELNINKTVEELCIPNGGLVTIHLKSTY